MKEKLYLHEVIKGTDTYIYVDEAEYIQGWLPTLIGMMKKKNRRAYVTSWTVTNKYITGNNTFPLNMCFN
jgi:hypothetical protein